MKLLSLSQICISTRYYIRVLGLVVCKTLLLHLEIEFYFLRVKEKILEFKNKK